MQELRVPTHRIGVDLATDQGQCMAGALFTSERPFHTGALRETLDLLNDERSFVPFQPGDEGGPPIVLGKRHIVRVHIAASALQESESDELLGLGDTGEAVAVLTLSDGYRVTGHLLVDTPREASRMLDKLNAATTFFAVRTDRGIDLVQTAHVVCVE